MTASALHELNNDIWVPFSRAYVDLDVDRYLALHASDFTWVRADDGIIEGLDDYSARVRQSFAGLPAGVTLRLDFRFTERIASPSLASERGIVRMSGNGPRGPMPVRHTVFHTIARRADGRWRFVVDYDGGATDTDAFDAAHAVDDVAPFTTIEQS